MPPGQHVASPCWLARQQHAGCQALGSLSGWSRGQLHGRISATTSGGIVDLEAPEIEGSRNSIAGSVTVAYARCCIPSAITKNFTIRRLPKSSTKGM
ncbi:hypothetical protein COLO4_00252 [Corchorus olitorius]|uniref:Uncharacterized protein n=1 Tax=Corchorus olitorius TaxID=93759 RepID=A0A1R3L499_9ROSI|nr:hypothetical protein COLO4_00252 [Corchorus olitorius]